MSLPNCVICNDRALTAKVERLLEDGAGQRSIAREIDLSRERVRKHLGHITATKVSRTPAQPITESGSVEITGDNGVIESGTVDSMITDWSDLLLIWNIDPDIFEVIEPVTTKVWDGYGKNEFTQEMQAKRLYSYRARIKKKSVVEETQFDIEGWRNTLQSRSLRVSSKISSADPVSYFVNIADSQFGKPGTSEAVTSWKSGVEGHLARIRRLMSAGYNISEIVINFLGDETENVVGNYYSQPYEVELNYSEQLELDFDMRTYTIYKFSEVGVPLAVVSVPSNHGEYTRGGSSKPITSIYDNASTMIARLVKKATDGVSDLNVSWHIATQTPDITATFNGVKANFSHGHIAKGAGKGEQRVKSAHDRQILGRTSELGDAQLFFTGHYHHYFIIEDKGRTTIGCPSLEAEKASDWFYTQYGVWSKPGMLGLLVGEGMDLRGRGYGEEHVI